MSAHNSPAWMLLFIPAAVLVALLLINTVRLQALNARQKRGDNLDFSRGAAWRHGETKANPEISRLTERTRRLTLLTVVACLLALNAPRLYSLLIA